MKSYTLEGAMCINTCDASYNVLMKALLNGFIILTKTSSRLQKITIQENSIY